VTLLTHLAAFRVIDPELRALLQFRRGVRPSTKESIVALAMKPNALAASACSGVRPYEQSANPSGFVLRYSR
jgi:hypothetical protein